LPDGVRKEQLMRTTLLLAGLMIVACGSAFAQTDIAFSAGSTNLLLAANGGRILSFSSELLDENKQPVPQWQVNNLIDGEYVTGSYRPAN
jgi:hypothetical protein